jgi:hypothetical protein
LAALLRGDTGAIIKTRAEKILDRSAKIDLKVLLEEDEEEDEAKVEEKAEVTTEEVGKITEIVTLRWTHYNHYLLLA